MALVDVTCAQCGKKVKKPVGEVNRSVRLGRKFFCGSVCSGLFSGQARAAVEVKKTCPHCGEDFVTTTKARAKKFCSRSCASKGSMSEERREAQRLAGLAHAQNLLSPAETLKQREAWKYAALEKVLREADRDFEFEYQVGGFVFDLALLDEKVLVEFDGPHHRGDEAERDKHKEKMAKKRGFVVVRREVKAASVISPDTIKEL